MSYWFSQDELTVSQHAQYCWLQILNQLELSICATLNKTTGVEKMSWWVTDSVKISFIHNHCFSRYPFIVFKSRFSKKKHPPCWAENFKLHRPKQLGFCAHVTSFCEFSFHKTSFSVLFSDHLILRAEWKSLGRIFQGPYGSIMGLRKKGFGNIYDWGKFGEEDKLWEKIAEEETRCREILLQCYGAFTVSFSDNFVM